jgi:hypothetical protein
MNSFLELPAERRRILREQGQQRLGLAPASIEKDFWVCWTLRALFRLPGWGDSLTFKGGTSLSKFWRLISRFSEDIDVVIDRERLGYEGGNISKKRKKKLVRECGRCIQGELQPALAARFQETLPADLSWTLSPAGPDEDPDLQTLPFEYPSEFSRSATYARPLVKIELGARSDTEPSESPAIRPYLADAFPELLPDCSFSLRAVAARRTFWEKAMLLHEETFRRPDRPRRARLSRHYYDLWCLITKGVAAEAVEDTELFERVASHRRTFFRQSWVDYETLRKGSLRLIPGTDSVGEWRRDYEAMRETMFFDDPPDFDEVLSVVRQFENDFNRL